MCSLRWEAELQAGGEVTNYRCISEVSAPNLAKRFLRLMPFDLVVIVTLMFLFIMCLKNKVVSILIEEKKENVIKLFHQAQTQTYVGQSSIIRIKQNVSYKAKYPLNIN